MECPPNIYSARSEDEWAYCNLSTGVFIGGLIITVITLVFLFQGYKDASIREHLAISWVCIVVVVGFMMYRNYDAARYQWRSLQDEWKRMAEKDTKYANYSEFIEYKQKQDPVNVVHSSDDAGVAMGILLGTLLSPGGSRRKHR